LNIRNSIRTYLFLAAVSSAGLAWQIFGQGRDLGVLQTSWRWSGGAILSGLAALSFAVLLGLSWTEAGRHILDRLADIQRPTKPFRLLVSLYLLASTLILIWLYVGHYRKYFSDLAERLPIYGLVCLLGGLLLTAAYPYRSHLQNLAFAAVAVAFGIQAGLFLPDVSSYPFSFGWSESSRYYFASLFFSKQVYGMQVPLPVQHPSRYLLQSLPFLIPGTTIWMHRLWQVLLWILLPLGTVMALGRHLRLQPRWRYWLFVFWAYLFIFQGPIYFHLTICLILVLLGYDNQRPIQTLVFVILASLWAGISRVNWIPVPGSLAVLLYLLENRLANRGVGRYLLWPAGWLVLGSLTGVGSQLLYAQISGHQLAQFGSSFTSDLLWYRLWPNPTYPEGILPSILFVSLPLFLLIGERLWRMHWRVHPLRLLGIFGILGVFFAGGLVVSVKIGGGNNLHNMDAYLFFLLVIAACLLYGRVALEEETLDARALPAPHWALLAFAISLPLLVAFQGGGYPSRAAPNRVEKGFNMMEDFIQEAQQQNGEVLFVAERQLLTFGDIKGVPLIPEYERTFLMEMAMSRSMPYLEQFYQDLENRRYALIISQPLNQRIKGSDEVFGEENDAWVEYVAKPILCYYEADETLKDVNLQFLIPRDHPKNCP
jgi:hypothetical protein